MILTQPELIEDNSNFLKYSDRNRVVRMIATA